MPILSVFFGMIVRMWHDDHPPPHVHVEYQGFVAQVSIETGNIIRGQLPRKAAVIVREWCLKHQGELLKIGCALNILSLLSESKVQIMTINLLSTSYLGERCFAVSFSDGSSGKLDMAKYLKTRSGPLLLPLADEAYLKRGFVDAGAFAWPNGLEISPERIYEISELVRSAA